MEPARHMRTIQTEGVASIKAQAGESLEHLKSRKVAVVVGTL